ncbi:MAG TPA: hypothetical protein VNU71_13485 [Burkholderiaceae bacterium]|nr:hypothetical protein [Burkholderiaceae bacterium]
MNKTTTAAKKTVAKKVASKATAPLKATLTDAQIVVSSTVAVADADVAEPDGKVTAPASLPAAAVAVDEGTFSLERAHGLPVLDADVKAKPFKSDNPLHVTRFGAPGDDHKLLQVVVHDGALAAQEIPEA